MTRLRPAAVIILAAGAGKRMRSDVPKVMHVVAGRTLLGHVLAATSGLGARRSVVVVGHGREQVLASLGDSAHGAAARDVVARDRDVVHSQVVPVVQERQAGTGHAVRVALGALDDLGPGEPVMVLPGDTPLLTASTLAELVRTHQDTGAVATLLTAVVGDATGYGRVVRDAAGRVARVVEHRDADSATAAIREINASVYVFDAGPLREALSKVTADNAQGEEYLTDVVGLFVDAGSTVAAYTAGDAGEVSGVNDRVQLAAAGRVLRDRIVTEAMLAGTTVVDPATTWIDADVTLEPDTTLLPNTHLCGRTHICRAAVVGPDCTLTDTVVGEGAVVTRAVAEASEIGARARVGPFTHLRSGTRLGADGKLGAFVETKSAELGEGTKVPHLSYVGDAVVGARTNIGCTAVFVNYDGMAKHRTVVGADVRIGSDTMIVAPVTIGDGAYTGAGALVKEDVPPGALAVNTGRQRTIEGWVERRRPGTAAAQAARRSHERETSHNGSGPGGVPDVAGRA